MKKQSVVVGLLVLLLVVAMTAAACGDGDEATTTSSATGGTTATSTGAAEPIKIGHIVDLTGFEATVGEYFKQGLEYAFNAVGNEVAGRKVEVIVEDSKSETQGALDAAKKLVESDGVDIIFGPTQTGQKAAVAEYCKTKGIPMLFYNATTPDLLASGNEWFVGSGGSTLQCGSCMADYTYNTLGYESVVTISPDNDAAREFMDPFTEAFEALGGTVVQQQWTALNTTDFAPYLTALEEADAVVAWEPGAQGIAFSIAYHAAGIDKKMPLIANYHGGFIDPWLPATVAKANAEAGAAMVGIAGPFVFQFDSQEPAWQEYVEGMTALLGTAPTDGATNATVQAAATFLAAVEATGGDTTPAVLRDALLATSIVGPESPQFFAAGDRAATRNVYIMEIQPGVGADPFRYVTVKIYQNVPPGGFDASVTTVTPTTEATVTTEPVTTTETTAAAGGGETGVFFEDLGNNVVKIINRPFPGAEFMVTTEGAFASKVEAFDAQGASLGLLDIPEAANGEVDYSPIADAIAKIVVTDMEGKVFEHAIP